MPTTGMAVCKDVAEETVGMFVGVYMPRKSSHVFGAAFIDFTGFGKFLEFRRRSLQNLYNSLPPFSCDAAQQKDETLPCRGCQQIRIPSHWKQQPSVHLVDMLK
jgi:hypothetical protein